MAYWHVAVGGWCSERLGGMGHDTTEDNMLSCAQLAATTGRGVVVASSHEFMEAVGRVWHMHYTNGCNDQQREKQAQTLWMDVFMSNSTISDELLSCITTGLCYGSWQLCLSLTSSSRWPSSLQFFTYKTPFVKWLQPQYEICYFSRTAQPGQQKTTGHCGMPSPNRSSSACKCRNPMFRLDECKYSIFSGHVPTEAGHESNKRDKPTCYAALFDCVAWLFVYKW